MPLESDRTVSGNSEAERLVTASAAISGVAAVVGLIFITIFYSGVWIFGPLNDIAYTTQLLFTLPIVIFLNRRLRPKAGRTARFLLPVGLIGLLAAISLQLLLIFGVLSFFEMIGPLLGSIVLVVVWFVLAERIGRDDPITPGGWALAVLAGLTFGYPVWAYLLIRNLKAEGTTGITRVETPSPEVMS